MGTADRAIFAPIKNNRQTHQRSLKSATVSMEFKPAYYAKIALPPLLPQEMDVLLANGYYRNGLHAVANSVRTLNHVWISTVMLRVRLRDFVWKKRLRKLLRTNNERFRHEIKSFVSDEKTEVVWRNFKHGIHQWNSVPLLEPHILRGESADRFNTFQISVFDGDKLVGFSIFDLGKGSLSSLEAAYDAEYRKHSIGIYTMLLEIEHCQSLGLDYYYPGFYTKDDPMFAYKLRPGNVEFFQVENAAWLPIEDIQPSDWKLEETVQRHRALATELHKYLIPTTVAVNHCLHLPINKPSLTASTLQLIVPADLGQDGYLLLFIFWNLQKEGYQVFDILGLQPQLRMNEHGRYQPHDYYEVQQGVYYGLFKTPEEVLLLVKETKNWVNFTV